MQNHEVKIPAGQTGKTFSLIRRLLIAVSLCAILSPALPARAQMYGSGSGLTRMIPMLLRTLRPRSGQYASQNTQNGQPLYSNTNPGGYLPSGRTGYDQSQVQAPGSTSANTQSFNGNVQPPNYAQQAYQNGQVQPYSGAYNTGYGQAQVHQPYDATYNSGSANGQMQQPHAGTYNQPGNGQGQSYAGSYAQPSYGNTQGQYTNNYALPSYGQGQ